MHMKRSFTPTYHIGYRRFQKQLLALLKNDISTVKRLAVEARDELELKRKGKMQLLFTV